MPLLSSWLNVAIALAHISGQCFPPTDKLLDRSSLHLPHHVAAMEFGHDLAHAKVGGDLLIQASACMPESVRVKGGALLSMSRADDAEASFMRSIELSRRQRARAWELRTATDLAARGRPRTASPRSSVPQSILEQFHEGLETTDLKAAQRLLTDRQR
jgi:hypothetical protein